MAALATPIQGSYNGSQLFSSPVQTPHNQRPQQRLTDANQRIAVLDELARLRDENARLRSANRRSEAPKLRRENEELRRSSVNPASSSSQHELQMHVTRLEAALGQLHEVRLVHPRLYLRPNVHSQP